MNKQQRGFYVTVTVDPHDFDGINDCGEPFQKVWLEKNYHDHVRVIALDDEVTSTPSLTLMTLFLGSPTSSLMVTLGG